MKVASTGTRDRMDMNWTNWISLRRKAVRVWPILFVAGAVASGPLACVDRSAKMLAPIKTEDLVATLTLSPQAVTMAVGDTFPLTVQALNLLGASIPISPDKQVTWTSADRNVVRVDANGVLRGISPSITGPVTVTATWNEDNVKRTATVGVAVTEQRYSVHELRMVVVDSTRVGLGGSVSFYVLAITESGDSVPGAYAQASHSLPGEDAYGVNLNPGTTRYDGTKTVRVSFSRFPGTFWVRVVGMMYGTELRDSLEYTGLYPATTNYTVSIWRNGFTGKLETNLANSNPIVQRCGAVPFYSMGVPTGFDVIFDDSTKASGCGALGGGGGNIINMIGGTITRRFPDAGTITWRIRDRLTGEFVPGLTGKVTMRDP